MEQQLKYVGNGAMLSIPSRIRKQRNLDAETKFIYISDSDDDVISFRIVRPQKLVFPPLKTKLKLSAEMKELISNPVLPTEEQLQDPRIIALLDEDFR